MTPSQAPLRPGPPIIPHWLCLWRFRFPAFALALCVLLWGSGVLASFADAWRSSTIALVRFLAPLPPDPNSRTIPLCVVFASHREDTLAEPIPAEGRTTSDPEEMSRRITRLLAAFAALPPEDRPRGVGLDFILSEERPATDPYLAAALRRLGNVYLAASQEPRADDPDYLLLPAAGHRDAAAGIGLIDFHLPTWSSPGRQARLLARGNTGLQLPDGRPMESLALLLAEHAGAPDVGAVARRPDFPMFTWNLYLPEGSPDLDREALVGQWPSILAHAFFQHAPAWSEGEDPEAWLDRVAHAFQDPDVADLALGALVRERIVLIGAGHPDDLIPTPFTSMLFRSPSRQGNRPPLTPGVVLHAMAIATLMEEKVPRVLADEYPLLLAGLIGGVGLGAWGVGFLATPLVAMASLAAFLLLLAGVDLWLLHAWNVWSPAFSLAVGAVALHAAGVLEAQAALRQSRKQLTQLLRRLTPSGAFVTLLPEDTLATIPTSREQVPRLQWRTALIMDLQGSTQFLRLLVARGHRALSAELMAEFYDRAVAALDQEGGELSDLTGDGIAAVFGQESRQEQALRALAAMQHLDVAFRGWQTYAVEQCHAAGIQRPPIPNLRVGIAGDQTEIRFFGNRQQGRPVFFGGAFIFAARVEQGIKKLPLPPGADGRVRICVEESVHAALGEAAATLQATFHRHGPLAAQGVEQPLSVLELHLCNPELPAGSAMASGRS